MITPPLMAAGITAILIPGINLKISVINMYLDDSLLVLSQINTDGEDLGFGSKLAKVILNSLSCTVTVLSLTYVLR